MENRIKEILEEKDLTPSWLSREIKLPYVTVYRWCKQIHQPSMANLMKVSYKLNVSVKRLISND